MGPEALNTVTETIVLFVETGGPVVAILLILSVFALALILLKLAQFFKERVGRHSDARKALEIWHQGDKHLAISSLGKKSSPLGVTLLVAMNGMVRGQRTRQEIEEAVSLVAIGKLHELQKGFRALDAISQIAPLLGLFGTVLGMIEAFQNLQKAGNSVDPSLLAGGIWVALMTTAVGLAVAMPVSLILTWFETRLENERVAIETMNGSVLSGEIVKFEEEHESLNMQMEHGYSS